MKQKQISGWLLGATILLIAWCTNPWQLYFLNDDFIHIPKAYDGTIGHHNMLRHVSDVTLYLNSLFFKENAAGYYATNLLLHLANIGLGIGLLKKIADSLATPLPPQTPILISCLFGVYAFHSEALFWVIGRGASLSFLFGITSWLCLFQSLKNRWWLLPMSLLFALGLFTYEAIWVFPFWLVAWYGLLLKQSEERRKAVLPIAIIWGLFILYFPLRVALTGEWLGSYQAPDLQQGLHLFSIAAKAVKLFARSFLPPIINHRVFAILFGGILLSLLLFARSIWKAKRVDRLFSFFVLAWGISYFPYLSLGISTSTYESERYLYFPSFFLCASFVYAGLLIWKENAFRCKLYLGVLFIYHAFFFIQASQAFKGASDGAKRGIAAIQSVPVGRKLVIENLPIYSHGIPVFNYGFSQAIQWVAPGRDTTEMEILSKRRFGKGQIEIIKTSSSQADTLHFQNF